MGGECSGIAVPDKKVFFGGGGWLGWVAPNRVIVAAKKAVLSGSGGAISVVTRGSVLL